MEESQNRGTSSVFDTLREKLESFPGKVSCVYRGLVTGETFTFGADTVHPSASVIKIFLMAFVFQLEKEGKLSLLERVPLKKENMAESCGVLNYLKDVKELSVRDLVELMIIISDNAATNVLLELVGMEPLQRFLLEELQLTATRFQRKMMDFEAAKKGLQNYTSARETADLLEKIYRGELISREASEKMLQILKEQQFDNLIPAHLDGIVPERAIAHKTGGLEHVVHDAGIIDYGKEPFLICFFGSEVDVPAYGKLIGDASYEIYQAVQGLPVE